MIDDDVYVKKYLCHKYCNGVITIAVIIILIDRSVRILIDGSATTAWTAALARRVEKYPG